MKLYNFQLFAELLRMETWVMKTRWPFNARANFFVQFEQFSFGLTPVGKKKSLDLSFLKTSTGSNNFVSISHHTLVEQWSCEGATAEKAETVATNLSGQLTEAAEDWRHPTFIKKKKMQMKKTLLFPLPAYVSKTVPSQRSHLTSNTVSCGRTMCQERKNVKPQPSSPAAPQPSPRSSAVPLSDSVRLVQAEDYRTDLS